jgi:predicted alpha/beta hydrolase family esterase
MKNVILFHGTGETPQHFWYPWLQKELEMKGYTVCIPELPNTNHPALDQWLPIALQQHITQESIIIGHSAGCPLILSLLEKINLPVKQIILVAAFFQYNHIPNYNEPILQKTYNWKKIAKNSKDLIVINADNDPWGCTDIVGKQLITYIKKGTLVMPKGEGHMGSDTYHQPYKEFPLLLKLID